MLAQPSKGFPGLRGQEPARQCRRRKRGEFSPWAGKMPWRRAWQPTPVLPGNPMDRGAWGLQPMGVTESDTAEVIQQAHIHSLLN